jgi:hypothetical protein
VHKIGSVVERKHLADLLARNVTVNSKRDNSYNGSPIITSNRKMALAQTSNGKYNRNREIAKMRTESSAVFDDDELFDELNGGRSIHQEINYSDRKQASKEIQ